MWFFGSVDLGKSVGSINKRALKIAELREGLAQDVLNAIQTRNTVIASIGKEIEELQKISA